MKKRNRNLTRFKRRLQIIWQKGHVGAIAGIITFYLLCCVLYWFVEYDGPKGASFLDILLWNTATLFGQDFASHYPETVSGRLAGIILLLISMLGASAITGFISSALVERRMNSMKGIRKLQNLKNHVVICGWKDGLKDLILDIIRKNKDIRIQDIVLVNTVEEAQIQPFLMDVDLKGIGYVFGDYDEEQILENANVAKASKVLLLGAERKLKRSLLAEAQKSTNYGEIVARIQDVKKVKKNYPVLNPADDYVLGKNMGLIVLAEEL